MSKSVSGLCFPAVCGLALAAMMALSFLVVPWPLPKALGEGGKGRKSPPPADQEYIGAKRCGSCHMVQFQQWKGTGHARAFEILTVKYQKDEKCLKCHTTGYGEATGFKDASSSAALAGVTCETCHGPGSKHEEVCKPFLQVQKLTEEQERIAKDSIWEDMPGNVCVSCHKIHGESSTPPELRKGHKK